MSNDISNHYESTSNEVACQPLGWNRFNVRWPTRGDCDPYGNIEVASRDSRSFIQLGEAEAFAYNMKRFCFWRTPTPLPDFYGMD